MVLHSDQLLRQSGHDAGAAADGRRPVAGDTQPNGLADRHADHSLCGAVAAGRRLAGPGAQAAGLYRWRKRVCTGAGKRPLGLGAGPPGHGLPLRRVAGAGLRPCVGWQRRADRADTGSAARPSGGSPCPKCPGECGGRSGRAGSGRCADQAGGRAAGLAG